MSPNFFGLTAALSILVLGACKHDKSGSHGDELSEFTNTTSTVEIIQSNGRHIYVTSEGRSVYVMDPPAGSLTPSCDTDCEKIFQPLIAKHGVDVSSEFGLIVRADGVTKQWSLHGKPLYVFSGDKKPAQMNGEATNDLWYVAKPIPVHTKAVNGTKFSGEALIGKYSALSTNGNGGPSNQHESVDNKYLFKLNGETSCTAKCAEKWKPLFIEYGTVLAEHFSVLNRADNGRHLVYGGEPIFTNVDLPSGDDQHGEEFEIGESKFTAFILRQLPFSWSNTEAGPQILISTSILSPTQNSARLDRKGFSLYTFDDDSAYTSNCDGSCAEMWPPFLVEDGLPQAVSSQFGSLSRFIAISRADGTLQWSFNLRPLYLYKGDIKQGDIHGDGVDNKWHLARPVPFHIRKVGNKSVWIAQGMFPDVSENGERALSGSDKQGYSIYRFDEDRSNTSNCNGHCAVIWPPAFSSSENGIGEFTILTRQDGSKQWGYKGSPLYFFSNDLAPNQTNGVYGTWHLVEK